MIIQRLFSLESGSYSGKKRIPNKSGSGILRGAAIGGVTGAVLGGFTSPKSVGAGSAIGGVIGAGLGAVTKWLSNIADQSEFRRPGSKGYNSFDFLDFLDKFFNPNESESETTTSESSSETDETGRTVSRTTTKRIIARPKREAEGVRYSIDGDPKKHLVSILFSGNSAALYINNADARETRLLDNILDFYCHEYKNADYVSEKVGKGTYFVDVKLLSGLEPVIGTLLIKEGIKLNIITGKRFGIRKR